jgi:hypothetical protein
MRDWTAGAGASVRIAVYAPGKRVATATASGGPPKPKQTVTVLRGESRASVCVALRDAAAGEPGPGAEGRVSVLRGGSEPGRGPRAGWPLGTLSVPLL